MAALETKLQQKNEVIAELMQEHVESKKELGERSWRDIERAGIRPIAEFQR